MALPRAWVEKIFHKLALVYGRDFLSRWEGQDLGGVMDDWAHELAALEGNPSAIAYGLEHLDADKPPTVLQFRATCNRRPEPKHLALPAPESKPAPEVMARVDAIIGSERQHSPKAWAWALKEREALGPGLTRAQREMWRTALADVLTAEAA